MGYHVKEDVVDVITKMAADRCYSGIVVMDSDDLDDDTYYASFIACRTEELLESYRTHVPCDEELDEDLKKGDIMFIDIEGVRYTTNITQTLMVDRDGPTLIKNGYELFLEGKTGNDALRMMAKLPQQKLNHLCDGLFYNDGQVRIYGSNLEINWDGNILIYKDIKITDELIKIIKGE